MYILCKSFLLVILSILFFQCIVVLTNEENHLITSLDLKQHDKFYSPKNEFEHKSIINGPIENHEFKDLQKQQVEKIQKPSISKKILKKPSIKKRPIKKRPTKKPLPKTTKKSTTRRTPTKKSTTRRPPIKKSTTRRPTTKKPITTTKKATTPKPDKYADLKSEILKDINKLRKKHQSPPLQVNNTIARDTQNYASEFAKTGGTNGIYIGPLGQLFYFASADEEIEPLTWWTRDSERIDFENINEGLIDPEFSQLIWKSTKQIGCGAYENNDGIFIFCRFYPKGNVPGQYKANVLKPLDS